MDTHDFQIHVAHPRLAATLLFFAALANACAPTCPEGYVTQGGSCVRAQPISTGPQGVAVAAGSPGNVAAAPPGNGTAAVGGNAAGPGATGVSLVPGAGSPAQAPALAGNAAVTSSAGTSAAPGTLSAGASGSVDPSAIGVAGTGPVGSGMTGPAKEPCSAEGTLRCAEAGVGKREVCQSGFWEEGTACAANETCTTAGGADAVCAPLNSLCKGGAAELVCDRQGSMLMCNPDGTASMVDTCSNAMLCMVGLMNGKCAMCMPGTSNCNGKNLQICKDDGSGFNTMDCITAELCNKQSGSCTPPTCKAGEKTCEGNVLKTCNASLNGWGSPMSCSAGCDDQNKRCLNCMPGERKCSGTSLQVCDSQGQRFSTMACDSAKPKCGGDGVCMECITASDCPEKACQSKSCEAGSCKYVADDGGSCKPTSPDASASSGQCVKSGSSAVCAPYVSIQSPSRGHGDGRTPSISALYVSAGGPVLQANASSAERFLFVRRSGSNFQLMSPGNGYVHTCSKPSGVTEQSGAGGGQYLCAGGSSGTEFTLSGSIGSQGGFSVGGTYIVAEDWDTVGGLNSGGVTEYPLRVRSNSVGSWETFIFRYQ